MVCSCTHARGLVVASGLVVKASGGADDRIQARRFRRGDVGASMRGPARSFRGRGMCGRVPGAIQRGATGSTGRGGAVEFGELVGDTSAVRWSTGRWTA